MNTFGPPQLVLTRGEGPYVWDADGNRYLDLLGGIAVNALGHAHPALVAAVTTQLSTLGHVSNFFATAPQVALAERLLDAARPARRRGVLHQLRHRGQRGRAQAHPPHRAHPRRRGEGSFHGRTMGALALTCKAAYREPFEPLPGDVTFVPYGDAAALAAAVTDETAAVVLEPVQGEAGVVVPPDGYLAAAREITARARRAALARRGADRRRPHRAWFAHTRLGRRCPTSSPLAKGLGGGIPIGACIGVGDAGHLLQPGNHGTTFGGNPVAGCRRARRPRRRSRATACSTTPRKVGERLAAGPRRPPRHRGPRRGPAHRPRPRRGRARRRGHGRAASAASSSTTARRTGSGSRPAGPHRDQADEFLAALARDPRRRLRRAEPRGAADDPALPARRRPDAGRAGRGARPGRCGSRPTGSPPGRSRARRPSR